MTLYKEIGMELANSLKFEIVDNILPEKNRENALEIILQRLEEKHPYKVNLKSTISYFKELSAVCSKVSTFCKDRQLRASYVPKENIIRISRIK